MNLGENNVYGLDIYIYIICVTLYYINNLILYNVDVNKPFGQALGGPKKNTILNNQSMSYQSMFIDQ